MRLYTFEVEGRQRVGLEQDNRLVDLSTAYAALRAAQGVSEPSPAEDMLSFLRAGSMALNAAQEALEFASKQSDAETGEQWVYDFAEVTLLAPIPRPGKILCAGVNYRGHLEENPAATLPESPFFFSKLPSGVVSPGRPIVHPRLTKQLDYEVELAVVIGQTMRNVAESQVMDHIFGFTILHDVSARDVQFKDNQITLGKNFDTFAPMGPCIVTKDEMPDLSNLRLRTFLNGKLMQDGSTQDWVFPLPLLLASLARVMTLEPGDVVSTGTPAGVGVFRQPPVFLQPGDTVVVEIEGIGWLENPVIAEE
jgi:2-keto-4-pentenoate hydratase/2-oxohepta-3-ene-1,7-dioic acid hydratase in catechol pathway